MSYAICAKCNESFRESETCPSCRNDVAVVELAAEREKSAGYEKRIPELCSAYIEKLDAALAAQKAAESKVIGVERALQLLTARDPIVLPPSVMLDLYRMVIDTIRERLAPQALAAEREKLRKIEECLTKDSWSRISAKAAMYDTALAAQKAAEERAEKSWNTAVETCARYAEDYERDERGRSTFIGERIADTLRREVRLAPQAPATEKSK